MSTIERSGAGGSWSSDAPIPHAAPDGSQLLARLSVSLLEAARPLSALGVPIPALDGKLLRPLIGYAMIPPGLAAGLDGRFWSGALAVQMAHEASLLHDDILDGAPERRGRETVAAAAGVGRALVLGDHLLTGAYRAAAATGSAEFLHAFVVAIERTVAGEIEQGRRAGGRIDPSLYEAIVTGKSGELFGAMGTLAGVVSDGDAASLAALGRRIGALYQRIDDLLDYCVATSTGKPALQDYRQRKWTWVLDLTDLGFGHSDHGIQRAIFEPGPDGSSPARKALGLLAEEQAVLVREAVRLGADPSLLPGILASWVDRVRHAVAREEEILALPSDDRLARTPRGATAREVTRETIRARAGAPTENAEAVVRGMAEGLGDPEEWLRYFGAHGTTFRLAARLFPSGKARVIAGIYAFCRFTDDLVDEAEAGTPTPVLLARWEAWRSLARAAYAGERTGITLLDEVLGSSAACGVSWSYPSALLDGVRMDLEQSTYPDWDALDRYTFAVAGAVGGWITQRFGLGDPALLERAHALGHAMQLTNIARDVGEDLARGRVYLPECLLRAHGVDREALTAWAAGRDPIPEAYVAVVEEVLERAERRYREASPAISALPPLLRRPVAAAAAGYHGIHAEIRRTGHDTLRARARTSLPRKLLLGAGAILAHEPPVRWMRTMPRRSGVSSLGAAEAS